MPSAIRPIVARLPQILLIVGALALMLRTERFFTPGTLASILAQASIIGVLAVGQAFVLIGGGFDLSQGALLALIAAIVGRLSQDAWGWPVCLSAALLGGLLLGSLNGLFVSVVRTNPFVTTMSTLLIFRGAAFITLSGGLIKTSVFQGLDSGLKYAGAFVSFRSVIFLAAALLSWIVLRWSVFGQHVYALGGNAEAARLAGVRTVRLRIWTFALGGLAAGAAAVLHLAWVRTAKADTAVGYEFDSIAACVVGGVSLQGGRGSVLGAAAGALLLQALRTQITMSGFPDEYRTFITGLVILIFAAADALARRNERA